MQATCLESHSPPSPARPPGRQVGVYGAGRSGWCWWWLLRGKVGPDTCLVAKLFHYLLDRGMHLYSGCLLVQPAYLRHGGGRGGRRCPRIQSAGIQRGSGGGGYWQGMSGGLSVRPIKACRLHRQRPLPQPQCCPPFCVTEGRFAMCTECFRMADQGVCFSVMYHHAQICSAVKTKGFICLAWCKSSGRGGLAG